MMRIMLTPRRNQTGFLGFILVSALITLLPQNILGYETKFIETPIGPAFTAFYIGGIVGQIFQGNFDIQVKTVLQCYLMDDEMFKGT